MSSYPVCQKMFNFQLFKFKQLHLESHLDLTGNHKSFSNFYFYKHLNKNDSKLHQTFDLTFLISTVKTV